MPLLQSNFYDEWDGQLPSSNVNMALEILSESLERMEISPSDLAERLEGFVGEVLSTDD